MIDSLLDMLDEPSTEPNPPEAALTEEVVKDLEELKEQLSLPTENKLPLHAYPEAIERVGLALMEARSTADDAEEELNDRAVQMRLSVDYNGLGSNEKLRESKLRMLLLADPSYVAAQHEMKTARRCVTQLTLQKERLENEFRSAHIRRREEVVRDELRARVV